MLFNDFSVCFCLSFQPHEGVHETPDLLRKSGLLQYLKSIGKEELCLPICYVPFDPFLSDGKFKISKFVLTIYQLECLGFSNLKKIFCFSFRPRCSRWGWRPSCFQRSSGSGRKSQKFCRKFDLQPKSKTSTYRQHESKEPARLT